MEKDKGPIARTPVPGCAACDNKRLHTKDDWNNHPFAGHGYVKEIGWTHPDLMREAEALHGR